MKKFSFILISVLFLNACNAHEENTVLENTPVEKDSIEVDFGEKYQADLESVDGSSAAGTVMVNYDETEYFLTAAFTDLPEAEEGFFYEGWIVRTEGELSVISTGKIENNMNFFIVEEDYTDHTQYVLTLEPDDGDPAPADHVMEGTIYSTN